MSEWAQIKFERLFRNSVTNFSTMAITVQWMGLEILFYAQKTPSKIMTKFFTFIIWKLLWATQWLDLYGWFLSLNYFFYKFILGHCLKKLPLFLRLYQYLRFLLSNVLFTNFAKILFATNKNKGRVRSNWN